MSDGTAGNGDGKFSRAHEFMLLAFQQFTELFDAAPDVIRKIDEGVIAPSVVVLV
ncbi:MAG: hypothetical protein JSV16_16885 [Candidatus Hydrogenedentota bacterium]|nr:MAG: hypothetical protein JSV16_16885 [Candidatus Hydrogenedentota bacterium]